MSKSIELKSRVLSTGDIRWFPADPSLLSNYLGNLLVAALPAASAANKGWFAFATNCCGVLSVDAVPGTRSTQGAGTGTGALVVSNGTVWQIAGTLITAAA